MPPLHPSQTRTTQRGAQPHTRNEAPAILGDEPRLRDLTAPIQPVTTAIRAGGGILPKGDLRPKIDTQGRVTRQPSLLGATAPPARVQTATRTRTVTPPPPRSVTPQVPSRDATRGRIIADSKKPPAAKTYPSLLEHGKPTRLTPAGETALAESKALAAEHHGGSGIGPLSAADLVLAQQQAGIRIAKGLGELSPGQALNSLSAFPETGAIAGPTAQAQQAFLIGRAEAQHNAVPANPSATDLYRAAYGGHQSLHWWDALTNLPKDFVMTPAYAAQGGFALGGAVVDAGRKAVGAGGSYAPLREVAAEQVDAFKHPGAFIEQHPFQALLAAASVGKGVGGGSSRIRGSVETPRVVGFDQPGYEGLFVNRGTYSANDFTRQLQKGRDLLTRRAPAVGSFDPRAGALLRTERQLRHEVRTQGEHERDAMMRPIAEARSKGKTSHAEETSLLSNQALGGTPTQEAAFYRAQRGAAAAKQADLREQQAAAFGDTPTPAHEAYLEAARNAAGLRTQTLKDLGLLSDYSATRREYHPLAARLASEGDETARRFLDADQRYNELAQEVKSHAVGRDDMARLTEDMRPGLREEYRHARDDATNTLHAFVGSRGEAPFRVPFGGEPGGTRRGFTRGIRLTTKQKGLKPYTGTARESGNYTITPEEFYRELTKPSYAVDSTRYVNALTDPANGLVKHAPAGTEIPEGWVGARRDNLRQQPKTNDRTGGVADLSEEAQNRGVYQDLLSRFHAGQQIPNDGHPYVLMPEALHGAITKTINPSSDGFRRFVRAHGNALRNILLYSRPAYPLTNLIGNLTQTPLENVGPGRYGRELYRGARGKEPRFPLAPGVEDRGFSATQVTRLHAQNLLGAYTRGIRDAAVGVDNAARRAVYLQKALPAARRLAHPEHSALQRFASRFKPADEAVHEYMRMIADGATPETALVRTRALQAVNNVLGDFSSMGSHPVLDFAVPFHRWTRFVSRLMGVTLPAHYPGKALLLYRLGSLGMQAQNQIGAALPPSLQGIIPFGDTAVQTMNANTYGTLEQIATPDPTTAGNQISFAGVASGASPIFQMVWGALTGRDPVTGRIYTNPQGQGVLAHDAQTPPTRDPFMDTLRLLAAQTLNTIGPLRAGAQAISGVSRPADTSVPLPGLIQQGKQSAASKRAYPDQPALYGVLNQILPLHLRKTNLQEAAKQGAAKLRDNMLGALKLSEKAEYARLSPQQRVEAIVKHGQVNIEAARLMEKLLRDPAKLRHILEAGQHG